MVLKKPSEYFKKDIPSVDNSIQEAVKLPELNTFSDAFQSFKNNLSKIEVLSEFSETLDNYRVNIERVNFLSEKVEDIQNEIQNLLKKEDLDRAIMSQLLVVEQSIQDLQNKVKGINEKNLTEIRLDVAGLNESVSEFLEVEVPKYKKLVIDSELRTNDRYEELELNVNSTLEGIGEFVDNKYQKLTESLQGINENSLSGIVEDFKKLDEAFLQLKEQEIPKYKGFIVESERKTEVRLDEFNQNLEESISNLNHKVNNTLVDFDEKVVERIDSIQNSLLEFIQVESPKYNKLLIENKLKTEEEVKIIQRSIEEKIDRFVNDIEELKKTTLNDSESLNQFVKENIDSFKHLLDETQKDVKKTLSNYTNISKTFEDKVTKDNDKIYEYEGTLNQYSKKIEDCLYQLGSFKEEIQINGELYNEWRDNLEIELDQKIQSHRENISEEIVVIQDSLSKKVSNLEIEIVRNESHIKKQNKNLEQIQEDVLSAIQRLNLEKLEEKNHELTKKIKYLEEIFEKFNEKEILSENIIVEPPSTKNEDPLTPLEQNFVTLDQLNQHYRLFLNRIQQQLATIGGGGETQLKYLDDIVGIATNASAYNNKFLKYNHSIGKFEFVSVGAGSQDLNDTLQLGNSSSLGMSVGVATVTSLDVDSVANFDTNTITFGSSSPTQIYSFSATQYRSAKLQIQITQGSDYQTSDILLIHNGSVVNIVEYASISTNDYLGTFDALISGGNVSLRVLMGSSSSSTIKVVSQAISL